METTQVRDIDGNTFALDDKDRVTNTLQEYGVLVICGQSSVSYETNSLNAAHAVQRGGFLGVTTPECIKTSNILHPASFSIKIYTGPKSDDHRMLRHYSSSFSMTMKSARRIL
jgi:hypothetical protein